MIRGKSNVYGWTVENTLPALGAGDGYDFLISFQRREAKIRSLMWSLKIMVDAGAGYTWPNLPLDILNMFSYNINIGYVNVNIVSPVGIVAAPAGSIVYNGDRLPIFKPGQYFFDNFYLTNAFQFTMAILSTDPVINYKYLSSFLLETEERQLY
jgi:hypothetical protein